jgi:PqqD family protein of HPr-rel-A system
VTLYARVDGLLIEPLGHLWAAFSPATGDTTLLNDEAVSILEVLSKGPATTPSVCEQLASDSGLSAESLSELVEGCWRLLIEAGLVRRLGFDGLTAT